MKIISINVAAVGQLFTASPARAPHLASAIHKQPVQGPVWIGKLGVAGDRQADLRLHGGPDKAVYAYPSEHYAFWAAHRAAALKCAAPLPPGSMGENLTLQGLLEIEVWIGDRLQVGDALLEVTEPRRPCFKLNAKMGFGHAVKLMAQSGFSGFYMRVLREGRVQADDPIVLTPGARAGSIAQVNARRRTARQPDLF